MKHILLFIFILLPTVAFLQPSKDTTAPYFKTSGYPDIKLLLTDSTTIYTKANLPKNKTVVILFFSPDCEHCQHTAKEITKKMDSLSSILMVWNGPSYKTLEENKKFYNHYHFNKYKNIVLGKEMSYYLPLFYRIEITPYTAVYKNGKLFTEFRNGLEVSDLIAIANNTYTIPTVVEDDTKN